MKMNAFRFAWSEIPAYNDRDAFVSDIALSAIWGDAQDAAVPTDRILWLASLWDVQHGGVPELLKAKHLTQAQLADRFGIPTNTAWQWANGKRSCPPHVLAMMTELLLPAPGSDSGWIAVQD